MEEFRNHCRFCSSNGIFELDIFQQNKESNSSIAEDLFNLCNIQLVNTEGLPTKICTNCNLRVTNLKDFLINLNKTQQMLLEFQNYYNRIKKKCELLNTTKNQENYNTDFAIIEYLEGDNRENYDSSHECESINDGIKNILFNYGKNEISSILEATNVHNIESKKQIVDSTEDIELKTNHNILKGGFTDIKKKTYFNEVSKSESLEKLVKKEENENTCKNEGYFTNDNLYSEVANDPKGVDEKTGDLKDAETLNEHNENDKKASVKKYKCNLCNRNFISKAGLISHTKTHSNDKAINIESAKKIKKEYLCPHCDRKFTSVNGRWSHIYTVHDKSMRVICDECGKEFPTKYHLVKHKVIHKEIKDLQCPHCPAKFKRQSGLYVHIAIHGESFSCEICGLVLNTQKLLNQHMIVHSDEKKYKCNFCDKNFKRARNLYSHVETHVAIRAFQCCLCNMSFVQYMTYRKHLKKSHPEKFDEMIEKGERISTCNALSSEQLKAINDAAKKTKIINIC